MKKLLIIIFLLISINHSFSQWVWQNPLPHGNNVNIIKFLNINTGWYFSGLGKNYKTTDAGLNWIQCNLPSNKEVFSAKFYKFDSSFFTCFLGLDTGIILKSTNSGINWSLFNLSSGYPVSDLFFVNQNTGYALSYYIYKTTNGGNNWIQNSGVSYVPKLIYFLNDSVGWLCTHGWSTPLNYPPTNVYTIHKTTNSGNNWTNIFEKYTYGENNPPLNLIFKDSYNGIVKFDTKYNSNDSGKTWTFSSDNNIFDFINLNTGYSTGNNKFSKTTDFGYNWKIIDSVYVGKINQRSMECIDSSNSYIGGYFGDLIKTTNGGLNWNLLNSRVINYNITRIIALDSLTLYALAPNKYLLKTTNGGNNWILKDTNSWNNYSLKSIFFLNNYTGWIGCNNGRIIKTTNGSNSWSSYSLQSNDFIKNIKFFSTGKGYLLDSANRFYSSSNFGDNWNYIFKLNDSTINFKFPDESTGYAYTKKSIYKTTNSGINWIIINIVNINQDICNLEFCNSTFGYKIELWGAPVPPYSSINTLYTTNGGINWTVSYSLSYNDATSDIYFVNQNIFYFSNDDGYISMTSNSGLNWSNQHIANSKINSIATFNKDIWVAGDNGIILKGSQMVPIGIRNTNAIIPDYFSLSQNYPNPFNPTTNIKYQITQNKLVTLKIFDILGKEIATLINEKQSPGTYEVNWDASAFPSGVYFYKLTTGDFTETKKMLLIK